ncbi:MAG: response regulator transcription factor [Clostridia bacterium]|nr:response regulator transcription factor [Clostridia bacterium]
MKKILIVEDDNIICDELSELLTNAGYAPIVLQSFQDAKEEIISADPDLILLDINIPYLNGELLLKELRKESNLPVIMVTSRNTEIDEVLSISYGADAFITKPYNPTILLLRIGAVLKRYEQHSDILVYKDLSINPQKGALSKEGTEILLTKNEMIIFMYLFQNQSRIVSRDELMTDLWNNNEYINDNALTVNISRLRSKLKEIGYGDAIETRKGLGYILL